MKLSTQRFLAPLFILLFLSCDNTETNSIYQSLPSINLGQVDNEASEFPLSQLVDDIEIVPLETREDIFISDDPYVIEVGGSLIVFTDSRLLRFDKNGKFLNEIGSFGRGPGEHYSPALLYARYYQSDSTIMALWLFGKPQLFKLDGEFIDELDPPFIQTPLDRFSDSVWFNTGSWAGSLSRPKDSIIFEFFSTTGKPVNTIPRRRFPDDDGFSPWDGSNSIGIQFPEIYVDHRDSLIAFYMAGNDTIYDISNMELNPIAVIDPGKYRIPYNEVIDVQEMEGKAQFNMIKETEKNIIFRKLNPTEYTNPLGQETIVFVFEPFQFVLYNKVSGKARTIKLIDDIFGLLDDEFIVPEKVMDWVTYDSHLNWKGTNPTVTAQAVSLVDKIDFSKHPELEKLRSLTETSNPVIFRLKLKDNIQLK